MRKWILLLLLIPVGAVLYALAAKTERYNMVTDEEKGQILYLALGGIDLENAAWDGPSGPSRLVPLVIQYEEPRWIPTQPFRVPPYDPVYLPLTPSEFHERFPSRKKYLRMEDSSFGEGKAEIRFAERSYRFTVRAWTVRFEKDWGTGEWVEVSRSHWIA